MPNPKGLVVEGLRGNFFFQTNTKLKLNLYYGQSKRIEHALAHK